jgi:hypothetical protein
MSMIEVSVGNSHLLLMSFLLLILRNIGLAFEAHP